MVYWPTTQTRKIVRNQDRSFIAYRENQHWRVLTKERNRYNKMLEYNKRHHLVTTIKETNEDPKQLFRALHSILGNKNENQLPKGTTNSQLAEEFTDYFLEKKTR